MGLRLDTFYQGCRSAGNKYWNLLQSARMKLCVSLKVDSRSPAKNLGSHFEGSDKPRSAEESRVQVHFG